MQLPGNGRDHGTGRQNRKIEAVRSAHAPAYGARRPEAGGMNHNERLMHLVLDNEASAEEERELLLLVAADPAARTQYEELRSFFDAMGRVPDREPPTSL